MMQIPEPRFNIGDRVYVNKTHDVLMRVSARLFDIDKGEWGYWLFCWCQSDSGGAYTIYPSEFVKEKKLKKLKEKHLKHEAKSPMTTPGGLMKDYAERPLKMKRIHQELVKNEVLTPKRKARAK